MKLDRILTHYTKLNSKWMKDQNVREETFKILEKNTGRNLFNVSHSNFLLDTSLEERKTKANFNYRHFIKIKSCSGKKTINKTKRHPTEWEKIFENDILDEGLAKSIKNLSN